MADLGVVGRWDLKVALSGDITRDPFFSISRKS
jgi:hypothetical protein